MGIMTGTPETLWLSGWAMLWAGAEDIASLPYAYCLVAIVCRGHKDRRCLSRLSHCSLLSQRHLTQGSDVSLPDTGWSAQEKWHKGQAQSQLRTVPQNLSCCASNHSQTRHLVSPQSNCGNVHMQDESCVRKQHESNQHTFQMHIHCLLMSRSSTKVLSNSPPVLSTGLLHMCWP